MPSGLQDWETLLPTNYKLLLAVFLAVSILAYVVLTFSRRDRPRAFANCRWYKDSVQPEPGLIRWTCPVCAEFGFTQDKDPPNICKRPIRPARL